MEKSSLKGILLEQKRELEKTLENKSIIRRNAVEFSEKFMETDFIKVVTGVRRCGKSVLALMLLEGKEFAYANFDDERLFRIQSDDLGRVLEVLHEIYGSFKYLFLDEVQNVEAWELFVNRCRRQGYNIILTGSNAKLLSKELATHITGRHIDMELYPFSFREYLRYFGREYSKDDFYLPDKAGEIKRHLGGYLESGGFPEALKYPRARKTYLTDLYNAILAKDVITRYNVRYPKILKDISTYLISNCGCEVSYNKIKNTFGLKSVHTVENYVSYIAEAYLIFQVFPFSFKVKEQLMSSKKVYAIDTGLVSAISMKPLGNAGRLMENMVFLELLRRKAETHAEIYYYKSLQQEEVDFAIRQGQNVRQLIQVCYSLEDEKTRKRELRALAKASKELKCKNLLVITWDHEGTEKAGGTAIPCIPLWKWLLD